MDLFSLLTVAKVSIVFEPENFGLTCKLGSIKTVDFSHI